MTLIFHIIVLVNIYAMLAVSLNLIAGYGGMLSLAQAGFYGIGAYATALLVLKLDWGFLPTVGAGIALAALVAAALGAVTLRFKDELFVIATFALQLVLHDIMLNWIDLTGGPLGISRIPQPVLLGWHVREAWEFAILSAGFLTIVVLLCIRLVSSPFGRILQAIREDEVLVRARGHNVEYYKVVSFVIGSGAAAAAGSLYAAYYSYIDPSSFTIQESILVLAMMIIGGTASIPGSILGVALLLSLPEALRFVGLPADVAAHSRQVIYGICLAALMLWRPQGLMGRYAFRRDTRS